MGEHHGAEQTDLSRQPRRGQVRGGVRDPREEEQGRQRLLPDPEPLEEPVREERRGEESAPQAVHGEESDEPAFVDRVVA